MKRDGTFDWVNGISVPIYFLIIALEVVIIIFLMYLWCILHENRSNQEMDRCVRRVDIERGFQDSLRRASERIYDEVCFTFVCVKCRLNNFQNLDKTSLVERVTSSRESAEYAA